MYSFSECTLHFGANDFKTLRGSAVPCTLVGHGRQWPTACDFQFGNVLLADSAWYLRIPCKAFENGLGLWTEKVKWTLLPRLFPRAPLDWQTSSLCLNIRKGVGGGPGVLRNQGTDRGPARTDGAAAAETPPHRGRRRDAFACGVQERSHPGAAFGVTHRREGTTLGAAGLEEVRTAKPRAVRPCPPRPPHPVRRGAHPSPSSPSLALRGPPGAPCSTRAQRSRRAQGPAGEADAPASPPTAWITEPCPARDPSRNSSPEFYTLSNAVHMHRAPLPRVLLDAQEKFPSNRDAYNRINSVLVGVLQRHGTNGMYIFIQWKEIYDRELAHSIMTPASPQMCGGDDGPEAHGS